MFAPRTVIAAVVCSPCLAGSAPSDELKLTDIARRFTPHPGPTFLYLNFDGWRNYDDKGHDVRPFESAAGQSGRHTSFRWW
jgi:hypothetical protein